MSTPPAPYTFALKMLLFALLCLAGLEGLDRVAPACCPGLLSRLPDMPADMAALRGVRGKILLFGDSMNLWLTAGRGQETFVHILARRSPLPLVNDSHDSYAAGEFHARLAYAVRQGARPALTIIPVNPHTFSPAWQFRPEWQFAMQNRMYRRPFQTRALAVLKYDFAAMSSAAFEAMPVVAGGQEIGAMRDLDWFGSGRTPPPGGAAVRNAYLLAYGTDVRAGPRWGSLELLLEFVAKERLPACFVLVPLDFEHLSAHLSQRELGLVEANLEALKQRLASGAVCWRDFSRLLGHAAFDHLDYIPNSHMTGEGHARYAAQLAELVEEAAAGRLWLPVSPQEARSPQMRPPPGGGASFANRLLQSLNVQ
jgi:hypothetical protein